MEFVDPGQQIDEGCFFLWIEGVGHGGHAGGRPQTPGPSAVEFGIGTGLMFSLGHLGYMAVPAFGPVTFFADRYHGPPDESGLVRRFTKMMDQLSSEPASDDGSDSDWQKGKAHIRALLARRSEAGNILVIARRLDDFSERNRDESKHCHEHSRLRNQDEEGQP